MIQLHSCACTAAGEEIIHPAARTLQSFQMVIQCPPREALPNSFLHLVLFHQGGHIAPANGRHSERRRSMRLFDLLLLEGCILVLKLLLQFHDLILKG